MINEADGTLSSADPDAMSVRRRAGPLAAGVLVAIVVLAVFAPLIGAQFGGFDDALNIAHNRDLNPPTWSGLWRYWRGPAFALYIPVTYTVWFALAAVSYSSQPDAAGVHLNPHVFHLFNVLLHVAAAVGVLVILRPHVSRTAAAVVGALLFALHPVQVEPVGWIAGGKDVLAGVLSLVALDQYLRIARRQAHTPTHVHWFLGTIAFVLAMLAKPQAVVVPAIALVLDRLLVGRPWRDALWHALPWLVLTIPCMIWTRLFQDVPVIERAVALWQRPLIAADALAFYLHKLIWPARLAVDYGRSPLLVIERGWVWWTWLVPAAVIGLALVFRRVAPAALAALLVFVLALLPVLGLVPFDFQFYSTVADHYLYLAMLGPAIIVARLIDRRPRLLPAAAILLVILATRSILQTRHWQDAFAIFNHAVETNPRSWASWNQLAMNYSNLGQTDAAIAAYRHALDARPNDLLANVNLANLLADRKEYDVAIAHYRVALEHEPPSPLVHVNLASVYEELGRYDEAEAHYRRALEISPGDAQASAGLQRIMQR